MATQHYRPDGELVGRGYCVRCGHPLDPDQIHGPRFCKMDPELVAEVRKANQPVSEDVLDLRPIGTTLVETSARLALGHTVGIHLEQGGRTYRFLMAPCWNDLVRPAAVGCDDGDEDIIVALQGGCALFRKGANAREVRDALNCHPRTARVIATYMAMLWTCIDAMSEDSPDAISTMAGDV